MEVGVGAPGATGRQRRTHRRVCQADALGVRNGILDGEVGTHIQGQGSRTNDTEFNRGAVRHSARDISLEPDTRI